MHRGVDPENTGDQNPKSVAEIKALLKKASETIPTIKARNQQEAMLDVVNVILNARVNEALSGERIFSGAKHPSVPVMPEMGVKDNNDYVSYLYSNEFVPAHALVEQRNAGRVIGWLRQALDEKSSMADKWISLLSNLNGVTAPEDINHVRTAIVLYCCARMVEGEYLRANAVLDKELADSFVDYSNSPALAEKIQEKMRELKESALVIEHGALKDKDSVINIVIDRFQQQQTERLQGSEKLSFQLPTSVVQLLVKHINRLINQLAAMHNNPGLFTRLFTSQKNSQSKIGELLDKIQLFSSILEAKDKDHLVSIFNSNLNKYDDQDKDGKAVMNAIRSYVQHLAIDDARVSSALPRRPSGA